MPLWQPMDAIARPAYYDRAPIPIIVQYSGVVAPHAPTTRASYTPPDGFANFLETMYLFERRQTAAAPGSSVVSYVELLPFYGGSGVILQNYFESGLVALQPATMLSNYGYIAYGDTIRLVTFDSSIGGSIQYQLALKGTEFLY